MAPTSTQWDCGFNTLRREHLFRNPPTDRTAYPALQAAVEPHISSFNRLFAEDDYAARRPPATQRGLIALGIEDIGYKTFLDGRNDGEARVRNRLTIRVKSVTLAKPEVPPGNRWAKRREIFPADARERHGTYRGRLTAEYEYRINDGDAMVFTRDLGLIPIMVKVGQGKSYEKQDTH
jgi:DNA-directed RNA polymerase I subunit RPA2